MRHHRSVNAGFGWSGCLALAADKTSRYPFLDILMHSIPVIACREALDSVSVSNMAKAMVVTYR